MGDQHGEELTVTVARNNHYSNRHQVSSSFLSVDQGNGDGTTAMTTIRGVVFARSIRAYSACFHVAMMKHDRGDDNQYTHVLVSIQFHNDRLTTALRSFSRRISKLGDLLRFQGKWGNVGQDLAADLATSTQDKATRLQRFQVNISSIEQAEAMITTEQIRHWAMPTCQDWQKRYRQKTTMDTCRPKPHPTCSNKTGMAVVLESSNSETTKQQCCHGGGVLGKRLQGECLADFLIQMRRRRPASSSNTNEAGSHQSATDLTPQDNMLEKFTSKCSTLCSIKEAVERLNRGTAVLDVAGGAGHVSMALGLRGVRSTVVDPRESVGILPKRDRKVWNRSFKQSKRIVNVGQNNQYEDEEQLVLCHPVATPYSAMRAWFGEPPQDIDLSVKDRHSDDVDIPVCLGTDDLIQDCSAIVALHPDEATDTIVDVAVKHRIPFMVVPCCVFSRFFPNRRVPHSNQPVCTYEQLLEYLGSKDESIQRCVLPFEGANVALWATFE